MLRIKPKSEKRNVGKQVLNLPLKLCGVALSILAAMALESRFNTNLPVAAQEPPALTPATLDRFEAALQSITEAGQKETLQALNTQTQQLQRIERTLDAVLQQTTPKPVTAEPTPEMPEPEILPAEPEVLHYHYQLPVRRGLFKRQMTVCPGGVCTTTP